MLIGIGLAILAALATVLPFGFLLPVVAIAVLCLFIVPLDKLLFYMWIGIFISAFFGAYLGIPGSENIFLFRILLLLHFILFLFLPEKQIAHMKPMRWLFFLLAAWLIGFTITLFWSESVAAGLRYIYYIFELSYLIFLSVYYLRTKEQFFTFSKIITVIYVLQIVIGLAEVFTGWHLPQSGAFVYDTTTSAFQPTGLLFNTNDYALFLTIFLPVVFWRLTKLRQPYRAITLVLVSLVPLYLVITTYSRLGLIAYVVVLIALLIPYAKKISILIGAWIMFLITNILLLLPTAFSKVNEIVDSSFTEKGASTSDRLERYNTLWQMIKDSKLLGVGAGNAPLKLEQYRLGHEQVQELILAPHNFWLELIADGGIFSIFPLVFFILLLGMSVYYWWTTRKHGDALFMVLPILIVLVFAVAAVALSTVIDKRYLWIAIGMAVAALNITINKWKERKQ
ncbi:O-antigen ligase family protein [Listeria booriae]|uniref:O-antigen ligase family protein n=1 Tax=Listeria booriae TaxID=1552123 RepID=UPI0016257149|nr:O-antigen ligase family protein [Listeria booriae]MBC2069195.1 O-antigen ligase family protein [Listeria booriae]